MDKNLWGPHKKLAAESGLSHASQALPRLTLPLLLPTEPASGQLQPRTRGGKNTGRGHRSPGLGASPGLFSSVAFKTTKPQRA